MKLIIEIPKEFESHFGWDRFEESFNRIYCDLDFDVTHRSGCTLSGKYELETIRMLIETFKNAEVQGKEQT